jgi:hypothetical protein
MNRKKLTLLSLALAPALMVSVMTSCSDNTRSGNGTVSVLLTDAPIDLSGVSAVNVTLIGVSLQTADDADGDNTKLSLTSDGDLVINLLDYQNGQVLLIATGDVPDGDYTKIRMLVSQAELVRDDDGDPDTPDIVEPIFNPSGKVDVPVAFTLSNGENMEITLDFDAALSVQVNQTNGQHPYILRPVINVVEMN